MADTVDSDLTISSALPITLVLGALIFVVVLACGKLRKNQESEQVDDDDSRPDRVKSGHEGSSANDKSDANRAKGKKKIAPDRRGRDLKSMFSHQWLLTSLKGHSGKVLDMDFSTNGKYMASCAEDRSVLIWNTKDFPEKDHKSVRANVEFDHAKKVKWSPDSKAFIICQFNGNTVEVFKLGKKSDGTLGNIQSVLVFPKNHNEDVVGVGIACTGKFIMSCSTGTTMIIWDLKGEVLATIDNHQMNTYCASVSPCGRFVASSGFTPDVKVWEVCFSKTGEFKEVARAFELKGHKAGVYSFSFNNDSSRMATVSKDSTWRFWDTKVEYNQGQDPHLLLSGQYPHTGPSHIALSPDGRAVAIASGTTIFAYSAVTGEEEGRMEDVHTEPIEVIGFDTSNKYLLSSGDKHIRVFHNVVGYKATLQDLEEKRRKATGQSMKDRIQQQIDEARDALKTIQESPL